MDYRSRRLRSGLLLGTAFVAGIAIGPASGLISRHLGYAFGFAASAAQDSGRADTYRLLTLFGDVFERVRAEYVDPVDDKDLVENSINGMLTGLDPHSSYMNSKAFRDMQVQTKGEFGGLGIEVTQDNGFIKVISPIDDTPASKAGIKAGDIITALDGKTVQGLSLQDAVDKMRGAPNSKITLTIKREGVDKPIEVSMLREVIHIQVVKQRMEPDDIGYMRLSQFTEQADAGLKQAVKTLKQQAGGKLRGLILDLRNNPGGLLDQAVAVSGDFINQGEIVSTRARHTEDAQRWDAKGERHPRRPAAGGADQRRLRVVQRNRRRRVAGSSPCGAAGHAKLRQGLGADGDPAARQRRHAADHGALLHAVRALDSGARHLAGRAGGRDARGDAAVRAGARGRPQPRAEEPGRHAGCPAGAAHRPAADRQGDSRQAAGGVPEVRSGQA